MIHFDLDARQINNLITELGLTERQAKFALGRALRRTAATLRKRSERGLMSELQFKKLAWLRRRLKFSRFSKGTFEGARIWYGANDVPISALRGSVEQHTGWAKFSGPAGNMRVHGGFVGKSKRGWTKGGKTIFQRAGAARLPIREAQLPVKDRMDIFVEDQIFPQIDEIFWNHFQRDMAARARYGVGNRNDRFS